MAAENSTQTVRNFKRREKKFLLDEDRYRALMKRLDSEIEADGYGKVSVLSLYYDTPSFDLIGRSVEKPPYKEKFRLRSYGVPGPDSRVFAEIKKKYNGTVYKRRVSGTPDEISALLAGQAIEGKDLQIQREIMWTVNRLDLKPAAFIGYDRTAYTRKDDPSLRITVDSDVRWRLDDLDLLAGDHGAPLREPGFRILEIKKEGNVPLWLTSILSEEKIYPGSFSKVGTCYTEVIAPALRFGKRG